MKPHPPTALVLLLSLVPGAVEASQAPSASAADSRKGSTAPTKDARVILTKAQAAPKPKSNASPNPAQKPAAGAKPTDPSSQAEQVINLRKAIKEDEEHFAELKVEREDQEKEYKDAQAEFVRIDGFFEAQKKALSAVDPRDQAALKEAQEKLGRIEKARTIAKDRFDLAIEDRKDSAEQFTTLEQKLQRDRQALDRLEGKENPEPVPAATPASAPTTPPDDVPALTPAPTGTPAATPTPAPAATANATPTATPTATPAPVPGATATATPAPVPGATATPAPATATPGLPGVPAAGAAAPESEELIEAKEDAQTKAAASKEAEAEAESVTERLQSLDKEIALEQKMLATGRKQRANAAERQKVVTDWFRKESLAGSPREKLDPILAQIDQVEARLKAANEDILEHSTRVEELQGERADLQAEQINALHRAEAARAQVKRAEKDIARLENPLALRNIARWLIDHALKLAAISIAMLAGLWLSKLFSVRVIRLLAHSGARGSSIEREARARTLIGVFHNAVSLAICVGGGLMILQEVGIPIAPLLGGAAVFGLAVAFGAPNLIRDYFYGFVILLENQYKLNDVVQIGALSGQVENITLRMTVLRDLEGRVHFMPNGQITSVTNMTHGWSRALFAIGVAYKERVDDVMGVLMSLSHELRNDPVFGPMILEDATMLGVDELADSAVVIKFFIKTRPLQQWSVKRELLRRIKNRFDELGIEIPFPQRTVWHRVEADSNLPETLARPGQILHGGHSTRQPA